jgi:hypothetical protein
LSVQDALAATQQLQRFCSLAGIPEGEGLSAVKEYLKAWDDRRCFGDLVKEVNEIGFRYQVEKKSAKEMSERVAALERALADAVHLKDQVRAKETQIAELSASKERKDARVDELRSELHALSSDLKKANAKAAALGDAQSYIDALSRLTILTRTRADYERTIIKLSPEQKKVLGQISLDADFLIKGAAGTGKTLVLLKAMERIRRGGDTTGQDGLGLPAIQGSIALLTYTKTLVNYDQYIATLLAGGSPGSRASTADSFLIERLREVDRALRVEYHLGEELAKQFPAAGLSPKDLAAEIDGFLWGNLVSYEEYVEQGIERRGMKRPLGKEQRMAVWKAAELMLADMEARKVYTRNSAALLLAKAAAEGQATALTQTDFIFIDEAQDLPAAVLKAIKACAKRCVILAGDSDQSIYQPGFSFKRADLDIAGRTRILRTNFRNTVQLHEVAERYRCLSSGRDDENKPEAYREGPKPELFAAADEEEMLSLLARRITFFLNVLGYAPENLCIIVPRDEDIETVGSRLSAEGLCLSDIRGGGYDFSSSGSVRLTTMHSAKGLDFPVVLLYLPQFHVVSSSLDPATSERMARNLIYVAITRAMDHLNVFIKEGTTNPPVVDLASCFAAEQGK